MGGTIGVVSVTIIVLLYNENVKKLGSSVQMQRSGLATLGVAE